MTTILFEKYEEIKVPSFKLGNKIIIYKLEEIIMRIIEISNTNTNSLSINDKYSIFNSNLYVKYDIYDYLSKINKLLALNKEDYSITG